MQIKNNPLVSVIIPTFNSASFIARTLQSVENQTYQNYQIVIVNDGSTDNTAEVIEQYATNNPKINIYHQTNQGVSVARNYGLEVATGKYVCFLDNDDTYEPTFLAKLVELAQAIKANAVYCGINCTHPKRTYKTSFYPEPANLYSLHVHEFSNNKDWWQILCIPSTLFKKEFLIQNNLKFQPNIKIGEDLKFMCQCLLYTEFYPVRENLFNYLYRESSATNSKWNEEEYLDDIRIYIDIYQQIKHEYKGLFQYQVLTKMKLYIKYKKNNYINFALYNKGLKAAKKAIKSYKNIEDKIPANKFHNRMFNNKGIKLWWWLFYYRYLRINFSSRL